MPISQAQREARRSYFGASDVAALFGMRPYAGSPTAAGVVAEKLGLLEPAPDRPWLQRGNRYEAGVLDFARERLGELTVFEPDAPALMVCPWPGAHLDAQLIDNGVPVEAKTSGLDGPAPEHWGEEGSDEIPEHYIIQLHVQMMATKADVAHLAALIGGRGEVLYTVERNREICEAIEARTHDVWHNYVLRHELPPDTELSPAEAMRLRRTPNKVVPVDRSLVEAWALSRKYRLDAEKAEEGLKGLLIAALGDAEAGDLGAGELLTYYEKKRKGYTVEPGAYRELIWKPGKGQGR